MHSGESRHPRLPFSLVRVARNPYYSSRVSLSLSHPPRCPLFYSWLVGLRANGHRFCRPTYLDDVSIFKPIQRSFPQIIHLSVISRFLPFRTNFVRKFRLRLHGTPYWSKITRFIKLFLIYSEKEKRNIEVT